jgi:hypothetical protein
MESLESEPIFDREKSSLREAYLLVDAHTPFELQEKYTEEDQRLIKEHEWDYNNPELIINKIKIILEAADDTFLTDAEKEWKDEILWFWYHHAISCAVWRYKDKEAAKAMTARARVLQGEDHPNQITKLFELLLEDRLEEAEVFVPTIPNEVERESAYELVEEYKNKQFI